MRKQFSLALILILSFINAVYAQKRANAASGATANIYIGKPYPVIDAAYKYYFQKNGEILTVKIDNKKFIIQKFGADDLSFRKIRVYEDMPKGFQVERVAEFNDRYYLFYSLWEGSKNIEQLFYREIDFDSGTFIGEGVRIVKVEGKITGTPIASIGFWSYGVTDKFDFQFSSDTSKMLVQYRVKPETKRDAKSHDVIGMSVFDRNIDLLWSKEVEMPYTEKKMNNLDYSIDSEENTYILTTVYNDNTTDIKKSKNGEANYHIELLRIKAGTTEIDITPIQLEDKFINGLALFESPENYMICAGFYNKGKDLDNANGIIMFKVGSEGGLYDIASYEIPLDVLNLYASSKNKRRNNRKEAKDKAEFENLLLRHLIVEADGSILLIGEQYYIKTHTQYSSNGMYTTTTYHYNDMLLTKIDANGQLAWMKKLPKKQKGGNGRGGMSYEYMRGHDSHYLLYLDNVKNIDLPLNEVPAMHVDGHGGYLTAYEIDDNNGEIKKISILDTRNVKGMKVYQFLTSRIVPISSGEFVFEVYKKKKEDVMIKVKLEE